MQNLKVGVPVFDWLLIIVELTSDKWNSNQTGWLIELAHDFKHS